MKMANNLPSVKEAPATKSKPANALELLANRLKVNPEGLEKVILNTVCKPVKDGDGRFRTISREEFISFVIVANAYGLNPLNKEIYAYPDKGAIVPVVSTDGWTRIMISHGGYKTHKFNYAEEITTPATNAKPCPIWIECEIEKKDGSTVIVREYLDECYRELPYKNPWQTHTKRMLRHKAKIQCAREAFGFAGIYDEDEAQRILEAKQDNTPSTKIDVMMPEEKAPEAPAEEAQTTAPATAPAQDEIPFGEEAPAKPKATKNGK